MWKRVKTLRKWMEFLFVEIAKRHGIESLMRSLKHVRSAGPYSRDEMSGTVLRLFS